MVAGGRLSSVAPNKGKIMTKPEDSGAKDGFQIIIDNKPHQWPEPTITGAQLKKLATVDAAAYDVWLDVPGPAEDDLISNEKIVDLTKPGVERFFTGKSKTTEG